MGHPAWSLIRLRPIERRLGAVQRSEAGVGVTSGGMGFRLRATQPGPKSRRAGGYYKIAGLAQHGQGGPMVTAEQRDIGRLSDGERLQRRVLCLPGGVSSAAEVLPGAGGSSRIKGLPAHQRRHVAGDGGQALAVGACHGRMPEGGHPLEVAAEVLEQAGRSKPAVHPPVGIGERIQVVQQGTVDAASILEVKQAIV